MSAVITLGYKAGTLELRGIERAERSPLSEELRWDGRSGCWRAPARAYAELVLALRASGLEWTDEARGYRELAKGAQVHRAPRPYQSEALEAWEQTGGRGVVALPTGAGKTQLALMAIDGKRRSALVVVPTLSLVAQWYDRLRAAFDTPVGIIGGGDFRLEPLTVTTYDSAYLHMERLGNQFGLVVFDECHHLPSGSYALAAELCLAPFRLGLSATPERDDGRDDELERLIGPIVYRREVTELAGEYLAEYETVRVEIELSPGEREEYERERAIYLGFVRRMGIRVSSPRGWNQFIMRAARSGQGRRALEAHRRQREIAFAAPRKFAYLEHLLHEHRGDRSLIFSQDNRSAYEVSRRFLVPVITHQTRPSERSRILELFAAGDYRVVAASRVLNEGVDVPEANVAVVLSGSGSVREHVQRLGRILRPRDGKHAVLYELVSAATSEAKTSERRRRHVAYR